MSVTDAQEVEEAEDEAETEVEAEAEIEAEVEAEAFVCELCGKETASAAGLSAHMRVHGNVKPPKKQDVPEGVAIFVCERYPKLVLAPNGKRIAQFESGRLVTENPKVQAVCRSLDYVEEVST